MGWGPDLLGVCILGSTIPLVGVSKRAEEPGQVFLLLCCPEHRRRGGAQATGSMAPFMAPVKHSPGTH